jgi:hypothetical protein
MTSSKESSIPGLIFCVAVGLLSGYVIQNQHSAPLKTYLSNSIASTKPYETFEQFYPHYLREHSQLTTRQWHYAGTSLMVLYMVTQPALLLPIFTAGFAGYAAIPFLRHLSTGLPEMAILLLVYLIGGKLSTHSFKRTLAPMLLGYGFAWVGHFFYEMNKPATFIYPTYSLMGDFRMVYDAIQTLLYK